MKDNVSFSWKAAWKTLQNARSLTNDDVSFAADKINEFKEKTGIDATELAASSIHRYGIDYAPGVKSHELIKRLANSLNAGIEDGTDETRDIVAKALARAAAIGSNYGESTASEDLLKLKQELLSKNVDAKVAISLLDGAGGLTANDYVLVDKAYKGANKKSLATGATEAAFEYECYYCITAADDVYSFAKAVLSAASGSKHHPIEEDKLPECASVFGNALVDVATVAAKNGSAEAQQDLHHIFPNGI